MKDETNCLPIKGFAGLKSSMYTFMVEDNHESKKAKGINKKVVADELKYEDYKSVLFNRSYVRHETNRIQSKNHNIGLHRIRRFICPLTIIKTIYLKMADCHIFINLLVKHTKNNFRGI